jgi:adenylylsulfate kinase
VRDYEKPELAELVVETDRETVEESVARIVAKLVEFGYLVLEVLSEENG